MKKHDIFQTKSPNGYDIEAVVIAVVGSGYHEGVHTWDDYSWVDYLCYSQNRLFILHEKNTMLNVQVDEEEFEDQINTEYTFGDTLVDYAILPDYDIALKNYNPENL